MICNQSVCVLCNLTNRRTRSTFFYMSVLSRADKTKGDEMFSTRLHLLRSVRFQAFSCASSCTAEVGGRMQTDGQGRAGKPLLPWKLRYRLLIKRRFNKTAKKHLGEWDSCTNHYPQWKQIVSKRQDNCRFMLVFFFLPFIHISTHILYHSSFRVTGTQTKQTNIHNTHFSSDRLVTN